MKLATELNPNSPEARFALGNALLRSGREEEALAAYHAAIVAAPEFVAAHASMLIAASGIIGM